MAKEWLYENAPLVEVIAEVHWKLISLGAVPGGAVDPFFETATGQLTSKLSSHGFRHTETLFPPDFPTELRAKKPATRFRREPGGWPLYQIGPGLFTANIVPPYPGWSAFAPTLRQGIQALIDTYPASASTMTVEKLALRYIDAFVSKHGRTDDIAFMREGLGIEVSLPEAVSKLFDGPAESPTLQLSLPNNTPAGSNLTLRVVSGKRENEPATVLQLSIDGPPASPAPDPNAIMGWFDEAHKHLHDTFEHLATERLKERMRPVREVG